MTLARGPLEELIFPVVCDYPNCGELLTNATEVDEHICDEHLSEAVWTFSDQNMRSV